MAGCSNSLDDYNRKRDFSKTAEPKGAVDNTGGRRFIVQKHAARRLHFDFRLEIDGVLKSWAVTKGPSPNPDDKRLAVRTEDHPLSYGTFEGTIPRGQYGGGTVMLWDEGTWAPVEGKSAADVDEGHLHFRLSGHRLKGEWLLVRMRKKKDEKRENWLLRKIDDDYSGGSDDLVERELTSIKTGRTMADIAADREGNPAQSGDTVHTIINKKQSEKSSGQKGRKKKKPADAKLPRFRKPQLATLVDAVPGGERWLHEIKYDGYRCLVAVAGERARIYTRSGKDWTDKFRNIAEAFGELDIASALIDGEIVQLDSAGNPSFSALQQALKSGAQTLTYFAFDLLELHGDSLASRSTIERKDRLKPLLDGAGPAIRYADHIVGSGEQLFETMCDAGQEGIISKRVDAAYRGRRTKSWLKIKCTRREEFVIVGWRESDKKGRAFASLLLAQHRDGAWIYKGRVGTGFTEDDMEQLGARLERLSRKTAPVTVPTAVARDAHWVTPKLVAEVGFAEYTADGHIRHGSFIRLRSDKAPTDVQPERSLQLADINPADMPVKISSRDRVIFPEARATKGDLADYYQSIGALMLPWMARRPISLVRCPQGRAKKCFFQKHDSGSFGDYVKHTPIREKDGDHKDYLYIENVPGILACVQMGTIEFHGWGATIDALERPDRMVFDLDPDTGLAFADVTKAAYEIRRNLADIGLVSFAMLSGGKGVHVIVPLTSAAEWPEVKDFARRFSLAMAEMDSASYTATMSKTKRHGKIFIDWLRNQRGATSVTPYSARARKNAPVAAPVTWEELKSVDSAARLSIKDRDTLMDRANRKDLQNWGLCEQKLPPV